MHEVLHADWQDVLHSWHGMCPVLSFFLGGITFITCVSLMLLVLGNLISSWSGNITGACAFRLCYFRTQGFPPYIAFHFWQRLMLTTISPSFCLHEPSAL